MIACLGCCSVTLQEPELFLSGQEKQKQMSSLQKREGEEEEQGILLINAVNVLLPRTVNRSVAAGLVALETLVLCVPFLLLELLRAQQSSHHPPCALCNAWTGSAQEEVSGPCGIPALGAATQPSPPSAPAVIISPSNTIIQINNIN